MAERSDARTVPDPPGLAGILAVIKRWRWMLVAATLAAGFAGYLTASSGEPTYESRAVLLVGPISTDLDTLRASGQLAQTYAELATSNPVLNATARRLGLRDARLSIEASANEVTRLLTVEVRDRDPQVAARVANAHAAELMRVAAGRRSAADGPGRMQVVDPAEPGEAGVGPGPGTIAALAALVGLLGALALALLLDRSGDAVRTAEDLEALTGTACVGSVGRGALRRDSSGRPIVERAPRSRAADEYRRLAARLTVTGRRSLLVLGMEDEAAAVALNLAAALKAGGARVAVVDVERRGLELANGAGAGRRNGSHGTGGSNALLERLAGETDVVLLHAPPIHRSPTGLRWAGLAEGTVLVAQRDRTARRELAATVESLVLVQANLVGTVLASSPSPLRR